MTNEVSNAAPVAFTPQSLAMNETKSVVRSDSGKQVPPPGQVQPEAKADKAAHSEADLLFAVEKFSDYSRSLGRELQFEVDKDSGHTVVKVIDPETEEVVRQIPSEEAVERARSSNASDMKIIDDLV